MLRPLAFAVAALGSLALGTSARAEVVYAVTTVNTLFSFDSNTPGTVSTPVTISGTTGGEVIVDIDYFALNQQIYGIGGNTGTLYSINPTTGVASADVIPSSTVGTPVSIDFDPTTNRLGIISSNNGGSANLGFRLTPSTGGASAGTVSSDGMFAYATGDQRANATPNLVGSAYTGNVIGGTASTTTLYGIDRPGAGAQGFLVKQPNGPGTPLLTVGGLTLAQSAFAPANNTGFDISGITGLAYVSEDLGASGEHLFLLNLMTGALNPSDGSTGTIGVASGVRITSITVVPEPGTWALCALGLVGVGWVVRRWQAS